MAGGSAQGRDAFARRSWAAAYEHLRAAADAGHLGGTDLERLAIAAYLIGKDDESARRWEEAHRAWLADDDLDEAARCAFWAGLSLLLRGDTAQGGGWLARSQRLVEENDLDCATCGYLLMPAVLQALAAGDAATALDLARRGAEIGRRFGDTDLVALAMLGQGDASIALGETAAGLALFDEAMVAVSGDEVSPIPSGIVYCGVIDACMEALDVQRAAEWTEALSRWCEGQPDLVPYRGQCLVHRAQIFHLHGNLAEAAVEAERACRHLSDPPHPALGAAFYQQAELERLRGRLRAAEAAYRQASRHGHDPAQGLALLRLAEGDAHAAAAIIRRALDETHRPLERSVILAAHVEVMRHAGDIAAAREAADELAIIAAGNDVPMMRAISAHASGSVTLAEGDPATALGFLRKASAAWQALDVPYEAARSRVMIGLACAALGDEATANLEFDAASNTFARLEAVTDLAWLNRLRRSGEGASAVALTGREREVLQLVASGKTNRDIATDLVISEHTVARHVQNIYAKIGVSSRVAAAGYAREHDLV